MHRDVVAWCKQCERCQKTTAPKAPLQPIPVTEPYEKMLFVIVGPFLRSKDGYKYVISAIRLASRYPEAIPLKDVRAETVAEGLVENFSRTGVPLQILTDQGSQLVGKLMKQLCLKLNIDKLQTTRIIHNQTAALSNGLGLSYRY